MNDGLGLIKMVEIVIYISRTERIDFYDRKYRK
jgi:hypothetical protein